MHATYKSFKKSKEEGEKHGGKPRRYSDLVMPLAYAICSAIIGTQSVVNAKCLSELLTLTFQGNNQMVRARCLFCICWGVRESARSSTSRRKGCWPSPLTPH